MVGPPPGTVLRVRGSGMPRIVVAPAGEAGVGNVLLRTPPRPTLLRVPGLPGAPGPAGGAEVFAFSGTGPESERGPSHWVRLESDYEILSVVAVAGQAPLGTPLVADVLIDDGGVVSSVFTDEAFRPQIAPTTRVDAGTSWIPTLPAGALLGVAVVAVGAVFPGANLTVVVRALPVV